MLELQPDIKSKILSNIIYQTYKQRLTEICNLLIQKHVNIGPTAYAEAAENHAVVGLYIPDRCCSNKRLHFIVNRTAFLAASALDC